MANTKYYSWSNFKGTDIKPGDEVSANKLGVNAEEFKAFVESGAVRTVPYPKLPEGYAGSPHEHRVAQLAAAARGEDYDASIAALGVEIPDSGAEPGKPEGGGK